MPTSGMQEGHLIGTLKFILGFMETQFWKSETIFRK